MRFHKALFFATILAGSALPAVAFGQFQAPTKEELAMTADPKAPGADAVFLYLEEKDDDPHNFKAYHARVKILTEKGKEAATVHIIYRKNFMFYATGDNSSRMASGTSNNWSAPDVSHAGEDAVIDTNAYGGHGEVGAIEGRTYEPDGTVVPLTGTTADLLKEKAGTSQVNEATFTMPDVKVGSVIEYRYQVRYDRFNSAPDWQVQQPYFVHSAHFVFTPARQFLPDRNLGGTSGGMSDSAILGDHGETMTDVRASDVLPPGKAVKQDGLGNWFVDLTDIPAIPHEPYSPPIGAQIYQVNFFYTFAPDAKTFWQKEMSLWMKDVDQYIEPTGLIRSTAQEATAGATGPLDKAKKLYTVVEKLENTDFTRNAPPFVATEYVPRGSVDTVLEHKAGNTEQITLLYLALARTVGLDARPLRVASRNLRTFNVQFQDMSQLDTVLIGVTIDGKEIMLDPGEKLAPFETLHWSHSGAAGLGIGSGGKVETVITPLQVNTDNTMVRVGKLAVTPQGEVSGTLKVGFVGQEALALRQLAIRVGPDAVKQRLEQLIQSEVPNGVSAHIDHIANLDDQDKQLVAVVPVTGSLSDHKGNHMVLPRLFFDTKETDPFPADKDRVLPVDMHYPAQEQEQITYEFPSGYSLEGAPADATWKWEDYASYQMRSKADASSITTARVLARGFTLLDANEYGKLRDFYDKVATTDRQELVLTAGHATGQ
jgi:transglutaminase-like putative cysteine protease